MSLQRVCGLGMYPSGRMFVLREMSVSRNIGTIQQELNGLANFMYAQKHMGSNQSMSQMESLSRGIGREVRSKSAQMKGPGARWAHEKGGAGEISSAG